MWYMTGRGPLWTRQESKSGGSFSAPQVIREQWKYGGWRMYMTWSTQMDGHYGDKFNMAAQLIESTKKRHTIFVVRGCEEVSETCGKMTLHGDICTSQRTLYDVWGGVLSEHWPQQFKVKLSLCLTKYHNTLWKLMGECRYSCTHYEHRHWEGGDWSPSYPTGFPPSARAPDTHSKCSRVGPRAGLDTVAKRKISSPCRESNAGRPARISVTGTSLIGPH
jgi:hypothetical protein